MLNGLSAEERFEAEKHDELYRVTRPAELILPPTAWTAFDQIAVPLNAYHASVKRLGDVSGRRVLDAGCGDGWLSAILAKRGAQVVGFDISGEAVRTAQARAEVNGVTAVTHFQVASLYSLPYETGTFDLITGQAILHHVRDKQRAAEELHRVLKRNGRAVFSEPLGSSLWLERLRRLVPVPSQAPEDPDEWRKQFKHEEIQPLEALFHVELEEFHFLSRLDRVVAWSRFVQAIGKVDRVLLRHLRWLRRYARTAVLELRPRASEHSDVADPGSGHFREALAS